MKATSRSFQTWLLLGASTFALLAGVLPARATPNHAHLHYMVGVRAYAGTRHAAMLHHEASAPGLALDLAFENAAEMVLLSDAILKWLERIEKEQSAEEASTIAPEMSAMKTGATSAHDFATELGNWIETVLAPAAEKGISAEVSAELQTRIAERSRELFGRFQAVLKQHKDAEKKLQIPVPPDPSLPSSSSSPEGEGKP